MDRVLYRCFVKATTAESGSPRRSVNWAVARRAWLEIYEDRLECGNWTIPFDQVTAATRYRVRQTLVPTSILEIATGRETYQFGLNPWANPFRHLPLEIAEERARLGHSPLSLVLRVILIGVLAYWLWKRFAS